MPKDPATETKVAHLYRYMSQCATVDSFRITTENPPYVYLFRHLPGPNRVERGIVPVGEFSLDDALEFLRLESTR